MTRTRRNKVTPAPAVGSAVYVLDAWNDTGQRSVVAVFATRPGAKRALARLVSTPGDWYAGIVKRTIR